MSVERLDALLHLGERIVGAVEAEDWDRVTDLIDRRARMIEQLGPADEGTDTDASSSTTSNAGRPEGALRQKRKALADQHETLLARLREREEEIEAELDQLQRLQRANDSYDDHAASPSSGRSGRDGVLPPELSG